MRKYTASPLIPNDPLIVTQADDLSQKDGSDVVVFVVKETDQTTGESVFTTIASIPGNRYCITSEEV
jgi:hypothetical protein